MIEYDMELGKNFRKFRYDILRVKQIELAKFLGVDNTLISRLERNGYYTTSRTVNWIAGKFGIDPGCFYGGNFDGIDGNELAKKFGLRQLEYRSKKLPRYVYVDNQKTITISVSVDGENRMSIKIDKPEINNVGDRKVPETESIHEG